MNTISDDENSRSVFDDERQTVSETAAKFEYVPSLDGLRAVAVIRLSGFRKSVRQVAYGFDAHISSRLNFLLFARNLFSQT